MNKALIKKKKNVIPSHYTQFSWQRTPEASRHVFFCKEKKKKEKKNKTAFPISFHQFPSYSFSIRFKHHKLREKVLLVDAVKLFCQKIEIKNFSVLLLFSINMIKCHFNLMSRQHCVSQFISLFKKKRKKENHTAVALYMIPLKMIFTVFLLLRWIPPNRFACPSYLSRCLSGGTDTQIISEGCQSPTFFLLLTENQQISMAEPSAGQW